MENTKNTSKESYLSKLKNTLVKHFTNTIKSEIQEYKDNMDLKYDLPVKTKESLAAYVQEMVKFNGSGKVSEKIRATKEEIKELLQSAKEQTAAALKGDKSKYDDDAMDDLLDKEFDLDLDEELSNESVEEITPVSADPGDKFEYALTEYGKPEKAAAAIFIKMLADANIADFGDVLKDKPEGYLKDLLDAAEVLYDGVNKPNPTDQDKEIERLSKTIGNPAIGMERDSFEELSEELSNVKPVINTTVIGELNPQQIEEFDLAELKELEKSYYDALNKTVEDIIISSKSLLTFNNYIASVCKSLLKDTENSREFSLDDPHKLVIELVGRISEGTITDYIPVTVFIGILLNLPNSGHYQTFRDLNTKFNEVFNKMN